MTRDQLRDRFPRGQRVINAAGLPGHVSGVAALPGGPVVYVTWVRPRYTRDGEEVPWRDTVCPESIAPTA